MTNGTTDSILGVIWIIVWNQEGLGEQRCLISFCDYTVQENANVKLMQIKLKKVGISLGSLDNCLLTLLHSSTVHLHKKSIKKFIHTALPLQKQITG